jgi:thiamine-phosphate pyrophosphorylase
MEEYLTASAKRAVDAATRWAARLATAEVDPPHLLLGIAEQEESRGASLLSAFGLNRDSLHSSIVGSNTSRDDSMLACLPAFSTAVRHVLSRARGQSVERGPDDPSGTDTLLFELLAVHGIQDLLASVGVDVDALRVELDRATVNEPLATEFANLELTVTSGEETVQPMLAPESNDRDNQRHEPDTYRILDACANRAREGLRVLEDYARFACDDPFLAANLKTIRHDLRVQLDRLPRSDLLASRDVTNDVGKTYSTDGEWCRTEPLDVLAANFKRTQEALRSLEEFGKLVNQPFAESIEDVRYRVYALEQSTLLSLDSQSRLDRVKLYLLVSSDHCRLGFEHTVREALAGGVQVIQLREKAKSDRDVAALGHLIRRFTRDAGALFIMNDRPDIARTVDADGVHLGQTELSIRDARRIVGPRALIGVSTHSIEQARRAVLDNANYIGVGPTFPSQTKSFGTFPGLDLVRQVNSEIRLPAFAIGGIGHDQLESVIAAGASRVAVSAVICNADDPRAAARRLRQRLDAIAYHSAEQ